VLSKAAGLRPYDVVLNSGEPALIPSDERTPVTISVNGSRDAPSDRTGRLSRADMAGRHRGGETWVAQLRASGAASPNLGVVMGQTSR